MTANKDLVILTADIDIEFTIQGLLNRKKSLGIREISFYICRHPERDPGCLLKGHEFLRPFSNEYNYAIIIFDHQGSGVEDKKAEDIEKEIEEKLSKTGWKNRATAIVISPELEIWVWSNSPHVEEILGWKGRSPDLKSCLVKENLKKENQLKPDDPKKAVEYALRVVKIPRSSSIYKQLAEKVSLTGCEDRAFNKLKNRLTELFPA